MKLLFKQRLFSWFDKFDIYDEEGNTIFIVEGQLAWGHKLVIYNHEGQKVGMVEERIFKLLPCFDLYVNDQSVGYVEREFTFFSAKYYFSNYDWRASSDFLQWDYNIVDGNNDIVATVSKELFKLTDTYVIEVKSPNDALLALMFVLAIDAEKCSKSK